MLYTSVLLCCYIGVVAKTMEFIEMLNAVLLRPIQTFFLQFSVTNVGYCKSDTYKEKTDKENVGLEAIRHRV